MNARQKAKYYKRKYEEKLKQPKTDIIQFEQFYPAAFIMHNPNNYLREAVVNDIARYMAVNLNKYIVYRAIYYPRLDEYKIFGRLRVVVEREV